MNAYRYMLACAVLALGLPFPSASALAQTAAGPITMTVALDGSDAVRGIAHIHETIAVKPGALTLVYPEWIPGEHAPSGPIANVAALVLRANGAIVPWQRDLVNLYAYHLDVPANTSTLDVSFDYLGAAFGNYSTNRFSTPNMFSVTWNKFVLYPDVPDIKVITVTPSITLPGATWSYATALQTTAHDGAHVAFAPLTMNQLIDSPLDAGTNYKRWDLGKIDGAPVALDVFADTPQELVPNDKLIEKFRALVKQMAALYHGRHFEHYNFLLTNSDIFPGEGVEHHQSSDNGVPGDFFSSDSTFVANSDLLAHEFNHSWDGKYRRPYDLATTSLNVPMKDDLLWVYEGMTQYYGMLQSERAGLLTKQQWLDEQADLYAQLDTTTGRLTRPLVDTAASGPFLYAAPGEWAAARRTVDFYFEGALMWLEADAIIRSGTHGAKSLDTMAREFFGRTSTGPVTLTYTRDDIVAAMNAVYPYDWRAFFAKHLDAIAPHPPDPFTVGGYKVVFTATPSDYDKAIAASNHGISARYSLGFEGRGNGTIGDVIEGSPAARAGIGPGDKIVAVNDRELVNGQSQIDEALKVAQSGAAIHFLLENGQVFRTVTISYTGGPRYPHAERVSAAADLLGQTAASLP